jgi:hypothetical protein
MRRVALSVGLLAMIALGCQAVQKGDTVMTLEKGTAPMMAEAPADSSYALYGQWDSTPIITVTLKRGDKLGFQDKDGVLYAVAGSQQKQLERGTYRWKRVNIYRAGSGESDLCVSRDPRAAC